MIAPQSTCKSIKHQVSILPHWFIPLLLPLHLVGTSNSNIFGLWEYLEPAQCLYLADIASCNASTKFSNPAYHKHASITAMPLLYWRHQYHPTMSPCPRLTAIDTECIVFSFFFINWQWNFIAGQYSGVGWILARLARDPMHMFLPRIILSKRRAQNGCPGIECRFFKYMRSKSSLCLPGITTSAGVCMEMFLKSFIISSNMVQNWQLCLGIRARLCKSWMLSSLTQLLMIAAVTKLCGGGMLQTWKIIRSPSSRWSSSMRYMIVSSSMHEFWTYAWPFTSRRKDCTHEKNSRIDWLQLCKYDD